MSTCIGVTPYDYARLMALFNCHCMLNGSCSCGLVHMWVDATLSLASIPGHAKECVQLQQLSVLYYVSSCIDPAKAV